MTLFEAILSFKGRRLATVFGVRTERPGEYHTDLWVDSGSMAPGLAREIEDLAERAARDWIAGDPGDRGVGPWEAFAFAFDDGREMEAACHGVGPDGFLHFIPLRDFIGPPCPMSNERYYRLWHPSMVRHVSRPRETVPYPDLPPAPTDWDEVFAGFLATESSRHPR